MYRFLTTSLVFFLMATLLINRPAYAGDGGDDIHPPFSIAGTVINPPEKSVLIEPRAGWNSRSESKATESSLWFKEGDLVQGYKLIRINKDKVTFAQSGKMFQMAVGYGKSPPFSLPSFLI